MKVDRNNFFWAIMPVVMWVLCLLTPFFIRFFDGYDYGEAVGALVGGLYLMLPLMACYMLNYYLLVPRLLNRGRIIAFLLVNLLVIIGINMALFWNADELRRMDRSALYFAIFTETFVLILVNGFAVGMSFINRWYDTRARLQEEQRKNAEAELAWLKNQLNPHFLFNTLNNISSLVQVDADKAQESIGQLSDLMRYTLYETNQPLVSVEGEIEFMENYIDLMRLRCNDLATIETDFHRPAKPMRMVPLLFISLIENAFKHGVNSRRPSFVRVRLVEEGDDLVFTCENSFHPKTSEHHGGSGIGLENLKRRLELTYPGRYVYTQEMREDTYYVQLILRDCV